LGCVSIFFGGFAVKKKIGVTDRVDPFLQAGWCVAYLEGQDDAFVIDDASSVVITIPTSVLGYIAELDLNRASSLQGLLGVEHSIE